MSECYCNLQKKLVGDGCEVCNPAKALEYAKETIEELTQRCDMLLEAMKTFTPAIDRVLWIALNWNDHNFDHEVIRKKAREAASALGIPDSDCGMNPSKERERLFDLWNNAIAAVEGEK